MASNTPAPEVCNQDSKLDELRYVRLGSDDYSMGKGALSLACVSNAFGSFLTVAPRVSGRGRPPTNIRPYVTMKTPVKIPTSSRRKHPTVWLPAVAGALVLSACSAGEVETNTRRPTPRDRSSGGDRQQPTNNTENTGGTNGGNAGNGAGGDTGPGTTPPVVTVPPGDADRFINPTVRSCRNREVFDPGVNLARRLTHIEVKNTVADLLGVDISDYTDVWNETFRAVKTSGFRNAANTLDVPLPLAESYAEMAAAVPERIDDFGGLIDRMTDCTELGEAACEGAFIKNLGLRVMRRPLMDEQVDAYRNIFAAADAQDVGFERGAKLVVEAMLQSPQFLYRTTKARGGDKEIGGVDDYELATNLSFFLWGRGPDAELMELAGAGNLNDAETFDAQVDRLVGDARTRDNFLQMMDEWMNIEEIHHLKRGQERFPAFTDELQKDMEAEGRAFLKEMWDKDLPISTIFNGEFTFASDRLLEFYGIDGNGGEKTDLSSTPERMGLLTQAGALAASGHREDPSLVERGLFYLRSFFCDDVPPPGDEVTETDLFKKEFDSERLAADAREPVVQCGGCHGKFDGLAYALEPYDGIGRYITENDKGIEMRQDGVIGEDLLGTGNAISYNTTEEFLEAVAGLDEMSTCMVRKPLQFALGRIADTRSDSCLTESMALDLALIGKDASRDASFEDVMTALAKHPIQRLVQNAQD